MDILKGTKPKNQTPSSSSYVPEWFLLEILFKLPSKSLFRFKCVSKQFLTVISDQSFIRDYISRASSKPIPWTFVAQDMIPAQAYQQPCRERFERNLFDSTLKSTPSISKLITPCPSMKRCKVKAISNGLCLCSWQDIDYMKSYSIFNPVTKQFVLLPPSNCGMQDRAMAFYAHVDQVGVVSYKVAHIPKDWSPPTTHLTIEEFSSETFEWTSFTAQFPEPISSRYLSSCFSFRGIFHWIDIHSGPGFIISYDPACIIRCPGTVVGRNYWCGEMVSRGGEYTVGCIKEDFDSHFICVSRLKDYEQGIWQLEHKFAISELAYADNKIMISINLMNAVLHPSEPYIFYFWGQAEEKEEWMLVSFNFRSRKSGVSVAIPRVHACGNLISFLSTPFVLPPWPAIILHPSLLPPSHNMSQS